VTPHFEFSPFISSRRSIFSLFFAELRLFFFMQFHWNRFCQKSQLSLLLTLSVAKRRVSQLEANTTVRSTLYFSSLLKRLNHTIIYFRRNHTYDSLARNATIVEIESTPQQRQAFQNIASSSNGHSRLIRERVSCWTPQYICGVLQESIAQPGVIRMESQFAMCRNNFCAPPIYNFTNVHVSRFERLENLVRDRLLNFVKQIIIFLFYLKIIFIIKRKKLLYRYASCNIGTKRGSYIIVYTHFSVFTKR